MYKSYKLLTKGVSKKDYYNPGITIPHEEFIALVENCDWLTWHEETEFGRNFYLEHPNVPQRMTAYLNFEAGKYIHISYVDYSCTLTFEQKVLYGELKLFHEFAKNLGEQSHVLSSVEDQCRWWYVPTDDVAAVFSILGIEPALKEADITGIIDDVQFENKIAVASLTGHTILFGFNAPYIAYPNLNAYLDIKDQHTPHLQHTLNKLSKAFGTAAYFEYNNDDEMIASLAWSTKGKFVYGRFTSEGEGTDVFGTQKKPMEVNQKTILKTAKKLGMTPEDILTGLMKQKMPVRYFVQPHWYIESKLKK